MPISGNDPAPRYGDYRRVFYDDFPAGRDPLSWSAYRGIPKGLNGWSRWNPALIVPGESSIRLTSALAADGIWESAGMSMARAVALDPTLASPYGKWLFRMRVEPDMAIGYVGLLYPVGGAWPPEIDIVEDFGGDRSMAALTCHWSADGAHQQKRLVEARTDFTQWTTVGLTIEPGRIYQTINGRRTVDWQGKHLSGQFTPEAVPTIPLWLGFQTHRKKDTPEPTPCALEIDWVAVYKSAESPLV